MTTVGTVKVKVVPDLDGFMESITEHLLELEPSLVAIIARAAHDLLFQYSEWLDSQGLIRGEAETSDPRTHDDLAAEYLART